MTNPSETKLVELSASEVEAARIALHAAIAMNMGFSDKWYEERWGYVDALCKAALASLADELRLAREDARRYRHIRKRAYVAGNGWMFGGHYKPIDKYAYNLKGADAIADCDAAIDEAMKNANKT